LVVGSIPTRPTKSLETTALEAAGTRDFRFHDLRHTTASMAALELKAPAAGQLQLGAMAENVGTSS
jgi:integrase